MLANQGRRELSDDESPQFVSFMPANGEGESGTDDLMIKPMDKPSIGDVEQSFVENSESF